jgi:hypothetical protein
MGAGFHLNQGNPLLHEIPLGDSLCPSHHVAVHRCNAPFDYGELAFVFTNHREPLKYNAHLQMSA